MKEFIVLSAVVATTKDDRKETFYSVKVTEDNYLRQKEYERLTGRKVNYGTGGSSLGYAVFSNDANFELIKKHVEATAAGGEPVTILIGDRKVEKVHPYYPTNPTTGKKAMNPDGTPVVKDEIMFFCPEGASATTVMRSITRGLEQVKIEGATGSEPDPLA